jgi:putative inorganic carbon (HCO3(-)) transporter
MLTALLLSLAAVFDMEMSFPKIAGLILGIAFYYGAVQYTRDYDAGEYHLLGLILVSGTGMAVIALLTNLQSPPFAFINPLLGLLPAPFSSLPDILGAEVNPNETAGVLGWLLPLLLAAVFGFWRPMWRSGRWSLRFLQVLLAAMLLLTAVLLLTTRSRGGILSVVIAFLLMLAIRYRWGRWFLLAMMIGTVALGFILDLGNLFVGTAQTASDFGLQGRLEIWSRALYGLADFPFTGMGMNGFRQVVHILYPLFSVSPTFDLGHAHNHLLQAGLDLGVFGLIAYLSIWLLSAALLWIGWKDVRRHTDRVLVIGLSGSLAAGWSFGVFDAIALGARPGFLWWLLIGLLASTFDNIRCYRSFDESRL